MTRRKRPKHDRRHETITTTTTPGSSPDTVPDEGTVQTGPRHLYLVTNTMNLNSLLGSRLLTPREAFHKYYTDLLDLAPGWIPLLTEPPTENLIRQATAEHGADTPVLMELTADVLHGRPADGPVIYLQAAPLTHLVAIHFRDEKTLREHRSRTYSNVFPHHHLLRVTPGLFTEKPGPELTIAPPPPAPPTDWITIDRVRGALGAAVAAADTGHALAVAAAAFGADHRPTSTTLPAWLTWNTLTGHPEDPPDHDAAGAADRLIFHAAYHVLGERDQTRSWSATEVLDAITTAIAATGPTDQPTTIVTKNLRYIRELINVERAFEPFRNPRSPHVAAKALLMVLLRPDLHSLLDWPADQINADPTTRVVAAILAGRLRGITRESVSLRNINVDDHTATWAARFITGHHTSPGPALFTTSTTRASLRLNGITVATTDPVQPDPARLYHDLDQATRSTARTPVPATITTPPEHPQLDQRPDPTQHP